MIKIDNLQKNFGACRAVSGVSFTVDSGEILGFLGPNGAGKSTTMKMITGFIKPSGGQVTVFGHDLDRHPLKAKALMGYLPEGAPAYGDMLVSQFLGFIAEIRGFKGAEKKQRIAKVIKDLELESVIHRPVDNLSKGFKRRVGIAQAIIHDPQVLILDEPTDGLDPNQKHQVRELIRGLSKDKIVIISTHILEEVTAVCTRAMIISNGQLVIDATPQELQEQSRYHRALTLQLSPEVQAESRLREIPGVAAVEHHEPGRFTLLPEPGINLFEPVNKLINEQSWEVTDFYMEAGRLDDVFRSLTHTDEEHGQERGGIV